MCLENVANIYKGQLLTLGKKMGTRMKSNIGIVHGSVGKAVRNHNSYSNINIKYVKYLSIKYRSYQNYAIRTMASRGDGKDGELWGDYVWERFNPPFHIGE